MVSPSSDYKVGPDISNGPIPAWLSSALPSYDRYLNCCSEITVYPNACNDGFIDIVIVKCRGLFQVRIESCG
jgi:hypothetical protein